MTVKKKDMHTQIPSYLLHCRVNSSIGECYCLSFSAVIFVPGAAEDEIVRWHHRFNDNIFLKVNSYGNKVAI